MLRRLFRHARQNVVAWLALFVALGGTGAYAANEWTGDNIVDGSLTGQDIFNNTVSGADITNGSLTGADVFDNTLGGADITNGSLTGADISNESTHQRRRPELHARQRRLPHRIGRQQRWPPTTRSPGPTSTSRPSIFPKPDHRHLRQLLRVRCVAYQLHNRRQQDAAGG